MASLPILNHWCNLPRIFWGVKECRLRWPVTYLGYFDLVQLCRHNPATSDEGEGWVFISGDDGEEYVLPLHHAKRYLKKGLIKGPMLSP
jgi:hypothetical protein